MALRKIHVEKISHSITTRLNELKTLSGAANAVTARISSIISANMEAERALDDEAHKLLDKNRHAMGDDIDEQKAFRLIKKQLAKQRNFVL